MEAALTVVAITDTTGRKTSRVGGRTTSEPPVNNNGGGYYGPQVNQRVPAAVATAAVVDDTTAGQEWRKERYLSARPKVHVFFPKPTVVPVAAAAAVAVSTTVDQQEPPKEPTSSLFLSRKVYVVFPKTSLVPVAAAASVAVRTTVDQEEWPEEPIDHNCLETGRRLRALLESSEKVPENVESVDKIWGMCCQWLAMDKRSCHGMTPYRARLSTSNEMITAIGHRLDLHNTDEAPCEDCKHSFKVVCMFEHTRDDGVERQVCGGCHGGYKEST
jgi:hypothetical protein